MSAAPEILEELPPIQSEAEIFWQPYPGKQTDYFRCSARECLFGGAAGPGKSECMLMESISYYQFPWMRSLIVRRTFPELKELMDRASELFPRLGGRYNENKKMWRFPSGARLEFGNLPNEKALNQYQSRQFTYIGFEELTHWDKKRYWTYMRSRLRSTKAPRWALLKMRGTTNPGGPGHYWVKKYFRISNAGDATDFVDEKTGFRRCFIPARISDNPALHGTDYERDLEALDEIEKKALKHGRWDVVAGAKFGDIWDPAIHIVDGYAIPPDWERWRGADDGLAAPHACYWITRNPITTQYVVYQEYKVTGATPRTLVPEIKKRDRWNNPHGTELSGIIDSSAFDNPGNDGKSRGKQMNAMGLRWKPCKKGPGSRAQRCKLLHQLLGPIRTEKGEPILDENGRTIPGLVVFRSCSYLIETLPVLPVDKNDPEDVDTDAEDHGYDGLTYGLQHRSSGGRTSNSLKGF